MKRILSAIVLLMFLSFPPALAQGAASIEGDVYLVNQAGDVKRGAAITVRLAPASNILEASMRQVCATHVAQLDSIDQEFQQAKRINNSGKSLAAMDSALAKGRRASDRMGPERTAVTADAAIATAPSGIDAHYRFENVSPGRYVIAAAMMLGKSYYGWAVPVTIASGQALKVDLDNNNVDRGGFRCAAYDRLK